MTFNGQGTLGYQLPELLSAKTATDIPLSLKQLDQWLSGLPMLNVHQLSYQIPQYLHKINRLAISEAQRFLILERLRPIVAHLYDCLIKQIRARNLNLSQEYREFQYLTRELVTGMAVGYQRLLFNKAMHKPHFFNRSKYRLLAERAMYYLGEQIRVSYILSTTVPKMVWQDFNAIYAYTGAYQLNNKKIHDKFAYHQDKKGSIDTLYHRILLLAMVAPYSLRSGELDQIYFGLEPWLKHIQLNSEIAEHSSGHVIDVQGDSGPRYDDEIEAVDTLLMIDNSGLMRKLKKWLETDVAPKSATNKGMSTKLLKQMIVNLDVAKRRTDDRLDNQGEQVEIVMGLQNIDVFLEYVRGLISNDKVAPAPSIEPEVEESQIWSAPLGDEINELQFYDPMNTPKIKNITPEINKANNRADDRKKPSVRRHIFTIENESETGVCISCNSLHGNGLFIGELMFIRGYDPEIWTLGVVRWMKLSDKKLNVGLYLLSAKVDRVIVEKQDTIDDVLIDALWLAEGAHGDTLLLPRAEFKTGDYLTLNHRGEHLLATLDESVWHSEGFAQFTFIVEGIDNEISRPEPDYLMAD